jgi:hypothetical protein
LQKPSKRHVPIVSWNGDGQTLQGPADADETRSDLLQVNERAIVMTLAAPKSGAVAVDRDKWDEHEVRLDDGMALGRLHDPERPGLKRVAGDEAERLSRLRKQG